MIYIIWAGLKAKIKRKPIGIAMSAPLQSRFFIVELEPYSYEQFYDITEELLLGHKVQESVVGTVAEATWNKSQDIRIASWYRYCCRYGWRYGYGYGRIYCGHADHRA